MPKLYEIAEEVRSTLLEVEESEDPQASLSKLDDLQASLERRVEWVGLRVLEMGHEIEALNAESKRLSAEAGTRARQRDWLKMYLGTVLTRAEMKRVDGNLCKVRRQKSPPSVLLSQALQNAVEASADLRTIIAEAFVRVIPERTEVDKRAILDHYKTTGEIPPEVEIDETRESIVVW